MEDEISNMCFETFDCDGVILEEEAYKDLEMISTTKGTLKAFIKDNENIAERLKNRYDISTIDYFQSLNLEPEKEITIMNLD